jgi:hypothetical protein
MVKRHFCDLKSKHLRETNNETRTTSDWDQDATIQSVGRNERTNPKGALKDHLVLWMRERSSNGGDTQPQIGQYGPFCHGWVEGKGGEGK